MSSTKRVVVLGGGGGIGTVATRTLAATPDADEVVVADLNLAAAQATVDLVADSRFTAAAIDVSDAAAIASLLDGAALVVNCVGPFYRFGAPILQAAITAGVDYVDVCDDLDATRAQLALGEQAAAAGVTALIGMGNSPGLANIFVKLCADWFLDEVTSADIMHIHGGESGEGAAVLKHRIHAMTSDVPLFIDGEFVAVRQLEESGAPHIREVEFHGVGTYPVYPYPHPETITLPTVFPSLRRATNLGVVFPLSYFEMTQDLVAAGMATEEPIPVPTADGVAQVAPIDAMVALLQSERPRLLAEAGVDGPAGCLKVVVSGMKDGQEHTYECSLFSESEGAGEGTGIPAGLGAALMLRGVIDGAPGVHPPEAIVPVDAMLDLAADVVSVIGLAGGGGLPLRLEHVLPDGGREEIPFSFGSSS